MAFKLTYTDGQADDYDDSTKWAVEDGVLKMGRESGKWTVLVSPGHWATIELQQEKDRGKDEAPERGKGKAGDKDKEDNEKAENKDKERADKDNERSEAKDEDSDKDDDSDKDEDK